VVAPAAIAAPKKASRKRAPKPRKRAAAAPLGRDYAAIAEQFVADVLAGKFPASRNFRAAIERQERDLATPPAGYVFDPGEATKWLRLTEQLPWSEGPKRGELIQWEPWQVWVLFTFFGWYDGVTREPRFNILDLWVAKGNGKSPLAAALAAALLARNRTGGKLYSAATAQRQARIVLDHAREMLRLAPAVRERFGLEVRQHCIIATSDPRIYEAVSREADTVEGIRPECGVVLDEVHVADRPLVENLTTAINKTAGGRFVRISTAGMSMDPQDVGFQLYRRSVDILSRKTEDVRTLAIVIDADPELDAFSDEAIRQANPNLEVSVSIAGVQAAAKRAREMPSERASYEVKHLNRYQASGRAFLDRRRWDALANPELALGPELTEEGWTLFVGVDLAKTRDLTAAVYVAVRFRDDGQREYRIFSRRAYLAEKSITLEHMPDAKLWVEAGWLALTPGATMDYGILKRDVIEDCERAGQPTAEVCVDEWSAAEVEKALDEAGHVVVAVKQGARMQSEPMKELEAATIDGRLEHDGSPVMATCIGNLIAENRPNNSICPGREDEHHKIDLAVGAINALVRASVADLSPTIYSSRGLVSV
jgi:phage terminase large subunit-like protein